MLSFGCIMLTSGSAPSSEVDNWCWEKQVDYSPWKIAGVSSLKNIFISHAKLRLQLIDFLSNSDQGMALRRF